ncbi:hypothetical protein FRB96_001234 [Tulasnella sp. 330]|nr:hypothetical protein FRB96_001234 [Tulasnella sp. 330]
MLPTTLLAIAFSALFTISEAVPAEHGLAAPHVLSSRRHHNKRFKHSHSAGSGAQSTATSDASTATSTGDSSSDTGSSTDDSGSATTTTDASSATSTDTSSDDGSSTSTADASAPSSTGGFISSAYMANWDGDNKTPFYPADMPVDQLTHVMYAFASIGSDGTITSGASDDDITKKFPGDTSESGNNVYGNFKQLYLLKQQNRNLKTSISIGGGGAKNFGGMTDASYRATFVKTAVQMVSDFGFDGVDVDWEFPDSSNIGDFYSLLSAFRTALDNLAKDLNTTPFLLSIAIPGGGPSSYYTSYISKIDSVLDMWNVMNYDLCGFGYQSTACDVANVKGTDINGQATINWLLQNGATASKIINGNPLYGYVYTGTSGHGDTYDKNNALPGDQGPGGYSVKDLPLSSMTNAAITEDKDNIASWAYSSEAKILASYDTPAIAALKAEWIMSTKLGGAMYWEISSDSNSTDTSLVYQYAETFRKSGGGLAFSCNHINYPNSSYDNIKNNMGITPQSCNGSSSSSGSGSSGNSTTTTSKTKSGATATGAATASDAAATNTDDGSGSDSGTTTTTATITATASDATSTSDASGDDSGDDCGSDDGSDDGSSSDTTTSTATITATASDATSTSDASGDDSGDDCGSDDGSSTNTTTSTATLQKRNYKKRGARNGRSKKRRSANRKSPLRLADVSI